MRRTLLTCSLLWLSFIALIGSGCAPWKATKAPDQEVAAYAPYWYMDDVTDSFIEIKNHLQSQLKVAPKLTLNTGQSIELDSITIEPLATTRVSLKSQPQLKFYGKTGAGRWGDGSRANSLLGNAQLIPVSPEKSKARDFSAWILTEDPTERLGIVTLFEVPADVINTVLEGLWWLPYPDTQAYYALQNTSHIPIDLQMELSSNGQVIKTKALELGPSAFKLINIGDGLKPGQVPEMGGIRFTYKAEKNRILPGSVMGRGRLLQEKLGFSASLMLHESLGNIPTDAVSELHAPAAYFGKLSKLSGRSDAYVHPHLLMRSIAKHDITVRGTVYGKDETGKPTELHLAPMVLKPQATMQVDLETQRRPVPDVAKQLQAPSSNLADGAAGLRLIHDGAPTDILPELINVDETGGFAFYDAIRNLFFHQTSVQTAISFNLTERNQSFIILKNLSDEPQEARIILNYENGRGHYNVKLATIPPQQNEIVDIRHLRDAQIPDRNGEALPREVTFGGAAVFSEPGAIAISDPTFIYATRNPAGLDPDGPDDSPFFPPSCGRLNGPPTPEPKSYDRSPFPIPCNVDWDYSANHKALDIAFGTIRFGQEVDAMEGGTIEAFGRRNPGENGFSGVVVRGDDNFLTIYGHVRPVDGLIRGQRVQAGQRIGATDNSGVFGLPNGGRGPCPNPSGQGCSHVHLARIRAPLPLPNRSLFDDILIRITPKADGGGDEGDFFGINCMSRQNLSRTLGGWPFADP
jgi:Peptidase family M23